MDGLSLTSSASASSMPPSLVSLCKTAFSPTVRRRVAKAKSGESYHSNRLFSLLRGEYRPALVLEKRRTSLRKANSPPVSVRKFFLFSQPVVASGRLFTKSGGEP